MEPAPIGPMYLALSPIASRTGLNRSSSALPLPTRRWGVPPAAPAGPPLTGASSTATPLAANSSCRRRITLGALVERSNQAVPGAMPASSPSSPSATASTSTGPGSEVKTTSDASPTWRGVSAQRQPASTWRAPASSRMSWTTTSWPALRRFRAMLPPIVPSPMNPTFIAPSSRGATTRDELRSRLRAAVERLLRQPSGVHACRPAGVEGDVRDQLRYLLARHAVIQRPGDVTAQLLAPIEGGEDGHRDHAAVALGELRPLPDVAEEDAVPQLGELRHDFVGIGSRLRGHACLLTERSICHGPEHLTALRHLGC